MKDEFGRKIMTQFVTLRQKTDSYLADNNGGNKETKGTKKYVIKLTET